MVELEDEKEQIRASLRGDHEAFAALIRRYQKMIHALTYRMTGSIADADDLAQETFVHAYRHLGQFRSEAKFSSWLYRIAVNHCINWQKRSQRLQRLHEKWAEEDRSSYSEDLGLSKVVNEALQKLHPKQRAAIVLTTYDGLGHAEAAKILGCSETTVSWRVFTARQKLKKFLRNYRKEASA